MWVFQVCSWNSFVEWTWPSKPYEVWHSLCDPTLRPMVRRQTKMGYWGLTIQRRRGNWALTPPSMPRAFSSEPCPGPKSRRSLQTQTMKMARATVVGPLGSWWMPPGFPLSWIDSVRVPGPDTQYGTLQSLRLLHSLLLWVPGPPAWMVLWHTPPFQVPFTMAWKAGQLTPQCYRAKATWLGRVGWTMATWKIYTPEF